MGIKQEQAYIYSLYSKLRHCEEDELLEEYVQEHFQNWNQMRENIRTLSYNSVENIDEALDKECNIKILYRLVTSGRKPLTVREKVTLLAGPSCLGHSLKEISKVLKIPTERVRCIEAKAFRKIRTNIYAVGQVSIRESLLNSLI